MAFALDGTSTMGMARFAKIEQALAARGKTAAEATLEEMDELWEAAKGKDAIPES